MRAYKTVNDQYIEPVSFTVPRRAESFQADIFPPAVGSKAALSSEEWLSGKTGLPPKIEFESLYEGNPPAEVPADFRAPASTAAPAPVPKPMPKKEPEPAPAPAPAARAPAPTMQDQKGSIAALASKYNDHDEEDDDDMSSFEEIPKPPQRAGATQQVPVKTTTAPPPKVISPVTSTPKISAAATPTVSSNTSKNGGGSGVESSLDQIKQLLETQTKMISSQGEQINYLTTEVEGLKKRVGSGSQDQSERVRQLELELESLRS